RFELLTSCLSSKRSKPTELTDHFLAKSECKSTKIFQTGKKKMRFLTAPKAQHHIQRFVSRY
ncbi:MAG: hypothetical protein K5918_02570, partial [Bacteroidales bacterium]|nr:hypothetical protein [Bacteroidales bacterium]